MRGLGDIITVLQHLLPTWALVLLGVVVALALLPRFRWRVRDKQVRESVRRMVRSGPDEREALEQRAFDRAGEDRYLLATLAREARKRTLQRLYQRAMGRLAEVPGGPAEAALIRAETDKDEPLPQHPLEIIVRVQALLDAGATEAARQRLIEGLAQHPDNPTLHELMSGLPPARSSDGPPTLDAGVPQR